MTLELKPKRIYEMSLNSWQKGQTNGELFSVWKSSDIIMPYTVRKPQSLFLHNGRVFIGSELAKMLFGVRIGESAGHVVKLGGAKFWAPTDEVILSKLEDLESWPNRNEREQWTADRNIEFLNLMIEYIN